MLRLAWKSVKHSPKRLILTTVAIVLATSFVSGTFVLTNGLGNSFGSMFEEIYSTTDVQVLAEDDASGAQGFSFAVETFDEELADRIAAVEGVEEVLPVVTGYATLLDSEGKASAMGPPIILINWTGDRPIDNVTLVEGHAPRGMDEVVLDLSGAKRAGLEVGDSVTFQRFSEAEPLVYTLVGTIEFGGSNALNGATLAYFSYEAAQEIAGQEGQLFSVQAAVAEGYDIEEVRQAIKEILPDGVVAKLSSEVVAEANAEIASAIDTFNTIILAFAIVAVFVGALLITNTFQTIVTQRTRELGLLRAIAASPKQIMRVILLEGLIVGLFGSLVGLLVGYGGATVNKLMLSTFADLGENIGALTVPTNAVLWGLITGIGTTVVAALIPAIHASRISPMEALRDEAHITRKGLRGRTVFGLSLLAAAIATTVVAFATDFWSTIGLVGIAGALALIGTILVAAALVEPIARGLRPVAQRVFGVTGTIAMNNARRAPRRTANTAGALMIGVLLLGLVTTLSTTVKTVANDLLVGTSSATFVIGGDSFSDPLAPMSTAQIEKMKDVDGVETVHYYGWDSIKVDGVVSDVVSIDSKTAELAYEFDTEPSFSTLDQGEIFVTESVLESGFEIGDTLTLEGVDATLELEIVGLYLSEGDPSYWITVEDGQILHEGVAAIRAWVVMDDAGLEGEELEARIEEIREDLESVFADSPRIQVETVSELAQSVNAAMDQLLAVLAAMLSMALVIGVFGVANTLFLSVTERTREIGLLRAVGVSRKSIRGMIMLESIFISILGAILGLFLGVLIGAGVIESFSMFDGYSVSIPWTSLLTYTIIAIIAGVVASLVPASRAANLDILKAIATE